MTTQSAAHWLHQRWGSLTLSPDQEFPPAWSIKSHAKFVFKCDCGRDKYTSMKDVTDCISASCGKCNFKPKQWWLEQTWGTLHLDPTQHLHDEWALGSNKKLIFICTCGRTPSLTPNNVVRGNYTTCGRCDYRSREYWISQSWDQLRLDPNQSLPEEWGPYSQIRFRFLCACGNTPLIRMCSTTLKQNTTCGKCNSRSKEFWLQQKWGDLALDPDQPLPSEWSSGAQQKFYFNCACGRKAFIAMNNVNSSCGKCTFESKKYWLAQTWGHLVIDPDQSLPDEWGRGFPDKLNCICDCGNYTQATMGHLIHGLKSCGCLNSSSKSPVLKADWLTQRWGSVYIKDTPELPRVWGASSNKRFTFICDCGREFVTTMNNVTNQHTQSCGKCQYHPAAYWLAQHFGELVLAHNQELPEEWGMGCNREFEFVCSCGKHVISPFYYIPRVKSCGCLKPGTTRFSPAKELHNYVVRYNADAQFSYWFKTKLGERREYDIYLPSKKLAIEYHGLYWHSEEFKSGVRDWEKYMSACSRGDRLIQIYSDEWSNPTKQEIFKAQLRGILAPEPKIRIKPIFSVELKTSPEVRSFLDAHHYLGAASGCVTVVARHREAIVGAWVFMKRETGVVLWHRACWDRKYKSWNPHEKALKLALPVLKEMGFTKIVTFSDNRFHTGNLYEKLGFKFEEDLKPDYSYTNGTVRKSKYALRVPAGVNEVEAAAKKGWFRVYDSGKRRYSLSIARNLTIG